MNCLGGAKSCSATDGERRDTGYRKHTLNMRRLTSLRGVWVLMSLDLAVVSSPLRFRSPYPLYLLLRFRSLCLLLSWLVARPRPFAVRYPLVRRRVPVRASIPRIYSCVRLHVLAHQL